MIYISDTHVVFRYWGLVRAYNIYGFEEND